MKSVFCRRRRVAAGLAAALFAVILFCTTISDALALEVQGVQPYALDQPRVPAILRTPKKGIPLSTYSELVDRHLFAFDCFLDTGASRIILSRTDRDTLQVKNTGATVEDYGIAGTETFDVSMPYVLCAGDSHTDITDPLDFRYCLRCTLQLRRQGQNPLDALPKGLAGKLSGTMGELGFSSQDMGQMMMPSINVVGTPFLEKHVAVLNPQSVTGALDAFQSLSGMGGSGGGSGDPFEALDNLLEKMEKSEAQGRNLGRIGVDILRTDQSYPAPQIMVPLTMKNMEQREVPVTSAKVPFVSGALLSHGHRQVRLDLLVDTAGAVSLISPKFARQLNLDLDRPQITTQIQGIGKGALTLKGYWIDRLQVPTQRGGPLVFRNVPFFVADVPGLPGSMGANLLIPSVYLETDLQKIQKNPISILGSLRMGPMPFRRIIIDLPRGYLGLDPAPQSQQRSSGP